MENVTYELVEDGHNEWRVRRTCVGRKWGIFPTSKVYYLWCPWYRGYESSYTICPFYVQIQSGDWGSWGTNFKEREHAMLALERKLETEAKWDERERKRNTVLKVIPVDAVEKEKAEA